MIRWVIKMVWVAWVTLTLLSYCTHNHPQLAYGGDWAIEKQKKVSPIREASKEEYVVVAGDTLGTIASRCGITWEQLWALNRDRIVNPHLIYVGQRIRIAGEIVPAPPPMTREEKIDRLAKFMCKVSGLSFLEKSELEGRILLIQHSLRVHKLQALDTQRQMMSRQITTTRQYEIWLLSEALVDTCKTDEEFYKMVGLAWQESHFVNRVGKLREVSFFQFLPSTIREWYKTDDIGLVYLLWELQNDPRKATELALTMMQSYQWNWRVWNRGLDYEYHLNNKIYKVKQEFIRR